MRPAHHRRACLKFLVPKLTSASGTTRATDHRGKSATHQVEVRNIFGSGDSVRYYLPILLHVSSKYRDVLRFIRLSPVNSSVKVLYSESDG